MFRGIRSQRSPTSRDLAVLEGRSVVRNPVLFLREEFMLASYMKSHSATFLLTIFLALSVVAHAQSGSSTSITGTVVDPSGAVVNNATVEVRNPVSGFSR